MNSKFLVIILCLLTSAVLIWQLILPRYNKIITINQEISQVEKRIQKLESLVAKLKELSQTYKEKKDLINNVSKVAPKGGDIPGALNRFESLSFQSGMILNSIDFSEAERSEQTSSNNKISTDKKTSQDASGLKVINVSIKTSGTYDSFRVFLDNLENCVRLTDIQTISFSLKSGSSDLADFSISANLYYQ